MSPEPREPFARAAGMAYGYGENFVSRVKERGLFKSLMPWGSKDDGQHHVSQKFFRQQTRENEANAGSKFGLTVFLLTSGICGSTYVDLAGNAISKTWDAASWLGTRILYGLTNYPGSQPTSENGKPNIIDQATNQVVELDPNRSDLYQQFVESQTGQKMIEAEKRRVAVQQGPQNNTAAPALKAA